MPDEIDEIENELRTQESQLEAIGRKICSIPGSGASWNAINRAIGEVQRAIHNAYLMRKD